MTLIEGICDEVIHFFTLLALVLTALIAWWSTNISERPLMRTVLILERRTTRHANDSPTSIAELRDFNELPSQESIPETERKTSQSDNETTSSLEVNMAEHFDNIFVNRDETENTMPSSDVEPKPCGPVEGIENVKSCSALEEESSVRNEDANILPCKEVSSEETDQNKCSQKLIDESSSSGEFESHSSGEGHIRIRLKYLNDDLQLVEGKLQEQLGDFKRRHFNLELSARKLVRLIFNGKVLQQDSKTLENYGFFDNCVVHCLVYQPKTPPPSPNLNRNQESQAQTENQHYHWDLGNILFASLSFLLGLAWYGRYQYAQLYTATTTVALISFTGMFTISLIGMYMPDMDGIQT